VFGADESLVDKYGVPFYAGKKPWGVEGVNIAIPAATQNEVNVDDVKEMEKNGVEQHIKSPKKSTLGKFF